ncbi:hypothetical protein ACE7GA_09445 [Roseomonas sp. CCTCC AB2023176]|uniref:hypothetical protein n=1 Tax=Roseomonas sp. CCTCC AB2023176 TaxID=3342640 RepID=UPI0035DAF845
MGTNSAPCQIHTTEGVHLYSIINEGKLLPRPCNVFAGESLLYFFAGRPSYKWKATGEASLHQLPVAFVFKPIESAKIRRVFPFDSGAFVSQLYPSYMRRFQLSDFELTDGQESITKLVSTFFGNQSSYLSGRAKSVETLISEYSLTPRHAAISALGRLLHETYSDRFDDRNRSIEVQVAHEIPLGLGQLLGVVIPQAYFDDDDVRAYFEAFACNVKRYRMWPLNVEGYFSEIYSKVVEISEEWATP